MTMNLDLKPYRVGYFAALNGQSLDSCRFSKTVKRNSWVRGYQDGKAELDRRKNATNSTMTEADRDKSTQWLANIRKTIITNQNEVTI